MNYWKSDENSYDTKIEEFSSKADLTEEEKEVLSFVVEGVLENYNNVSTKHITKWIDEKVSVLLSVKKKVRKFA